MDYGLKRNGKRESRERRGRRFSYLPAEQVIMQLTTVLSPYESLMDFMDEITARRIELLQENQNASEYLGTRVTTKTLYDTVVGIGNVEIRLYKIEEKREYPITWSEVAKNSGGEGFLSAFIILNSLLYYMRRIFSQTGRRVDLQPF